MENPDGAKPSVQCCSSVASGLLRLRLCRGDLHSPSFIEAPAELWLQSAAALLPAFWMVDEETGEDAVMAFQEAIF